MTTETQYPAPEFLGCYTCAHEDALGSDAPCASCGPGFTNWTSPQESTAPAQAVPAGAEPVSLVSAVCLGLEYAREALATHDQQFGGHPATALERGSIAADIATMEAALVAPVAGAPVCPQCGMAGQHKMQCSFGDAQRLVLPAVMSATATQPVAQPLSPWIPSHERVPAVGTECVVLLRYSLDRPAFVGIDKWDVQREDPTGMGGPTLETGEGWNDNYESDVIAWFAIPARPPEDWDQRLAGSAGGEG